MHVAFNKAVYYTGETGLGTALVNDKGAFFCGFEQKNGTLVANNYHQVPRSDDERPDYWRSTRGTDTSKPVFLSPAEMKEKGVAAAVFQHLDTPGRHAVIKAAQKSNPSEYYKTFIVQKDLTHIKDGRLNFSQKFDMPGLASAQSCLKGRDNGYANIGMAIRQTFKRWMRP